MRIDIMVAITALALSTTGCATEKQNPEAEKAAVEAATAWLTLTDAGNWAESYAGAAAHFRGAVTEKQWADAMTAARTPLGSLVSRKVKRTVYRTSLPGAPDGEYVVIQFKTSFANKQAAIETVTPMKQADGSWRVSGYFIK